MKVASLETHDIDIDAALRVFDPDRYSGGIGDGVWHKVTRPYRLSRFRRRRARA